MSNAAVINATHNSGQTAGSPVTIEAGGDVVLKAFGSGSGAWSVTLAFAPSTNESPVTLTISNVSPSARTSVVSTGATSWVGWVVSQSGEWEASGVVEGYQPDEALAGDLGVFVPGTAPTKAVKPGATYRDTSGVQYVFSAVAGWVGDGVVYNGSTSPIPTTNVGPEITVENLNMPSGKSRLCWNGTKYAPCAGDVIAAWSGDPYLTQATPGVQSLYKAYQSPIIPDYLIPDGVILRLNVSANIKNVAGVGGCHLMSGVSGSDPSDTEAADYALGIRSFVPNVNGRGFIPSIGGYQRRSGNEYRKPLWGTNASDLGSTSTNAAEIASGPATMGFVPGSNRLYVKAVTISANDIVTVNFAQISVGM